MKFIKQTKLHIPGVQAGNCYPTCIACIMELEEIPPFELWYQYPGWETRVHAWLFARGWCSYAPNEDPAEYFEDVPYMAWGPTERFDTVLHQVIYRNGKLLHDPHPDGTGLSEVRGYEVLEKITYLSDGEMLNYGSLKTADKGDFEKLVVAKLHIKKLQTDLINLKKEISELNKSKDQSGLEGGYPNAMPLKEADLIKRIDHVVGDINNSLY